MYLAMYIAIMKALQKPNVLRPPCASQHVEYCECLSSRGDSVLVGVG